MERRVILAIVLMIGIAVAPSLLWPPKPAPVSRSAGQVDTLGVRPGATSPSAALPTESSTVRPPVLPTARVAPADTVWVTSDYYRLGFSTRGGALVAAQLTSYKSFASGDSAHAVQLVPDGRPLLAQRLAITGDTLTFADLTFTPSAPSVRVGAAPATLTLTAERPGATVTLTYRFTPGEYRFGVTGQVTGLGPQGAVLVVGMGDGLRSVEADSSDDYRHYAVVTKASKTESKAFTSLKPGESAVLDGPFEWAGLKTKYFLVAALAIGENQQPFGGAIATGGARDGKTVSRAALALTLPVPGSGGFRYDVYAGPLEYRRLANIGHDLDDANPYGGIFRPIVKPVAELVVNILLWLHGRLHISYGWTLVLFGVLVRVLLWPLNQKAMESSMRMQAVAPLLKDVQTRHKNDPEKLQKETMRLYKEHQVNPFGGCLPMLIPMPVLIALFYVFANTIEFRGVPFLWLPDLSRADPYFIIPVLMGVSMFALSKIGQLGMPPNPQAKTMLYIMPAFMTFLFLRFSSGLNVYYAVSNLFSLPQQWLIAQRRLRKQGLRPPGS